MSAKTNSGGFLLPFGTLWWRDMVRFVRQRSRIAGILVTPLLFWLFIGSGLGDSFQPSAAPSESGYLQYFFPGTVVMVVLFTAIFSAMSVIEDRREGFLLSVLVAPVSRSSLVLGKVMSGTTQALLPGLIFLLLGPAVGFALSPLAVMGMAGILFLIAFSLACLGFLIAWRMDSVQGFHAVLNLVLMPMWLLSGALFPASGASVWIRWIMKLNPLTYGVAALRRVLYGHSVAIGADVPALGLALGITALFGLGSLIAALVWAGRITARHLG